MRLSANVLFAGGATLIVCIAIAGGIALNGFPSEVRLQRLDEQKLNDLSSIARGIEHFYASGNELPDSLLAMPGPRFDLTDRETGEEYEYRMTGEATYELCATFHLAFESRDDPRWAHAAGHQCFALDATDLRANTFGYRNYQLREGTTD